jgi:hypothetical protein
MRTRSSSGPDFRAVQIFVLITPVRTLSTPAAEYEVTAKYQVPAGRLVTV